MTRSRGFSLLELMVALAILSVVVTSAMAIVVGVNGSSVRVRKIGDAQVGARQAIDELALEIRQAGSGAASGQLGIAPGGGPARRIPVIYSGPNVTITEPGGQTVVTNSIFIISADSQTLTIAGDGAGMQGIVTAASQLTPLTVVCSNASGTSVDCSGSSSNPGLLAALPRLLVGDLRNAVYLTPVSLGGPSGTPATQQLDYAEKASAAYAPDPKAPFGFAPGAQVARARVAHWYLRQASATDTPVLVRSYPVLTSTALNVACAASDVPFVDETTSTAPGTPVGTVMSTAPIDSLQIRYITDPTGSDDPTQFTSVATISVCDTSVPATIREVRLQVVARTDTSDYNSSSTAKRVSYSTPGWEGVSPTVGAGAKSSDAYPRRAFTTSVVPRSVQGVRL